MKSSNVFILAASLATLASTSALAVPTLTLSAQGLANAQAAETNYLNSLSAGYVTEDFEDFTAGSLSKTFDTAVGTFTQEVSGNGGNCAPNCNKGLAILDNVTTHFSGRYAVSGDNWLDSWDSRETQLTLNTFTNSLGFYLTDPNDEGGRFSLSLVDGQSVSLSFGNVFGQMLGNGKVYYVTVAAEEGIKEITIFANHRADGYGIDKLSVANVPAPLTASLLGLGFVGLLARRRTAR